MLEHVEELKEKADKPLRGISAFRPGGLSALGDVTVNQLSRTTFAAH